MPVTLEQIADDDSMLSGHLSRKELLTLLQAPHKWVKKYARAELTNPYTILLSHADKFLEDPIQVEALVHTSDKAAQVSFIRIQIDTRAAVPKLRTATTHSAAWTQVRADFPGPLSLKLVYTRQNTRPGSILPIRVHLDLDPSRPKISRLVDAIAFESDGLAPWLQEQNVVERKDDAGAVINRPAGTQDFFNVVGPVKIEVLGFDPSIPCPTGTTLFACSITGGTYAGDPTKEHSHIDLDNEMIKWYCK